MSLSVTWNGVLDQMDLTDIFRAFHPKAAEYTSTHVTFSRIDHMLGHKTSLNKFKKIGNISSIFSDHKAMKCHEIRDQSQEEHWKIHKDMEVK